MTPMAFSFDWSIAIALVQIILIDILLGGDNAIVIALACRRLPEDQRGAAIFFGVAGAIIVRILLLFFVVHLMALPGVKLFGGALLVWIALKLLRGEDDDKRTVGARWSTFGAVCTIVAADVSMSLDNVVAVAGAANGDSPLVVFGIVISIPIIVYGSKMVMALMERYPVVITLGGALLGYIAGGMFCTDPMLELLDFTPPQFAIVLFSFLIAWAVAAIGRRRATT